MTKGSKPADLDACEAADHGARARVDPRFDEAAFERAAGFFRAAGDVARLKLLTRLAEGERCVTELAQAASASLPTVSQQLRLLRAEGLVRRRRVAKHVYYALIDAHVRDLLRSALDHAAEGPAPPDDD